MSPHLTDFKADCYFSEGQLQPGCLSFSAISSLMKIEDNRRAKCARRTCRRAFQRHFKSYSRFLEHLSPAKTSCITTADIKKQVAFPPRLHFGEAQVVAHTLPAKRKRMNGRVSGLNMYRMVPPEVRCFRISLTRQLLTEKF
jgi:hypothetical protein